MNPDIDEAHRLKGWYEAQGKDGTFSSHSGMAGSMSAAGGRGEPLKTLLQVKEENLGMGETPDYFSTKATIIYIKQESFSYPACLSADCNKKVVEEQPGEWQCARCEKTYPKPEYRYILSANVSDFTGQVWLNCFDDQARIIMGITADQLNELKENDEKAAEDLFQEANCKTWLFKCRAKMDTFQDQQRWVFVSRMDFSSDTDIQHQGEISSLGSYSLELHIRVQQIVRVDQVVRILMENLLRADYSRHLGLWLCSRPWSFDNWDVSRPAVLLGFSSTVFWFLISFSMYRCETEDTYCCCYFREFNEVTQQRPQYNVTSSLVTAPNRQSFNLQYR